MSPRGYTPDRKRLLVCWCTSCVSRTNALYCDQDSWEYFWRSFIKNDSITVNLGATSIGVGRIFSKGGGNSGLFQVVAKSIFAEVSNSGEI